LIAVNIAATIAEVKVQGWTPHRWLIQQFDNTAASGALFQAC
jgi:hypothetical protein